MKNIIHLGLIQKRSGGIMSTSLNFYSTNSLDSQYIFKEKSHAVLEDECTHISNIIKSGKNNVVNKQNSFRSNKPLSSPRVNDLKIQMLSENLHNQIFKKEVPKSDKYDFYINKAIEALKRHNLWSGKDNDNLLKDVFLELPSLKGADIEEHFYIIGEEQSKSYKTLVLDLISKKLPNFPDTWVCQKGWTKYEEGKEPVSVPFPDEKVMIFDVEVLIRSGGLPTLATAVSNNAWYGWVSSNLANGLDAAPVHFYTTQDLISVENKFTNKTEPRIIIGHNVSYDRARIKEQYKLENSALRFLDTMALHTCIGGINKNQTKDVVNDSIFDENSNFCLVSLKNMYSLYCNKELLKEKRNIFLEGSILDVKSDFNNLMIYCAHDAIATFEILQQIFPIFLERFPHPVTLAGMLEMSVPHLPVNNNWKKFIIEAEQTYEDLKHEMNLILLKKSDMACRLFHDKKYKNDLWLWNENWSTQSLNLKKRKLICKTPETILEDADEESELMNKYQYLFDLKQILPVRKPFLPGYPLWYRKLCEKGDFHAHLTTGMSITPKLLQLTWEKFPVYHVKKFGWGILVADIFAENVNTNLPFAALKELTLKVCNISPEELILNAPKKFSSVKGISQPPFYYKGSGIWCDLIIDDCCYFFKLPHKDGPLKNVGNPLSKNFSKIFASTFLSGSDYTAKKVIDLGITLSYWRNNRDRIKNQMVVWLGKKELPLHYTDPNEDTSLGVIIPTVVVCGTITRRALEPTWLTASKVTENRIGSELRALVQAPRGYHIVGADVDSEELWIAALLSDSSRSKIHGGTPIGWMTLQGGKLDGTDMHSLTAKASGISREHAKVLNYARIYGAGVNFAQKLLQQFNPSMSSIEASEKAKNMYKLTKGVKLYKVKPQMREEFNKKFGDINVADLSLACRCCKILRKDLSDVFEFACWANGTESDMFNKLEKVANSLKPETPFLSCRLSRALEPKYVGDLYHINTRVNWVVQSGAVDFLHLMLVCMRWLTRGEARYCFSFHDEIRYIVPSEKKYATALAVHLTNLYVRSFCCHRLKMYDLPQSVAFFSSVEVDTILRKEAKDNCITPSNPHGMEKGYGIPPGESLSIYDAIEKSGGNLSLFTEKQEMSQAIKRRYIHREILQGDFELPTENESIVRVLASRGNNLHEVEAPNSSTFLVSMPSKFRKSVWIKKGDYILVQPIQEGEKVKAEMVKVIRPDYIKFLKKENAWPLEFLKYENNLSDSESENELFVNKNKNTNLEFSKSSSSEDTESE